MKLTSSIAMCTYNGERFLQQQLDSIANQIVLPDELIVCDDGSTDSTISILEEFVKKAPFPVQLYRNPKNLGYSRNFEKSASLCSKDIVLYCDQDDIWKSEKLETVLNYFQENSQIGLLLHGYKAIDSQNNPIEIAEPLRVDLSGLENSMLLSAKPFIQNNVSTWYGCMMAYRNAYSKFMFPFNGFPHDSWTLNSLSCLTEFCYIDKPLILHRIHEHNTADIRLNSLTRWGAFRFIPKLYMSILKRLGIDRITRFRKQNIAMFQELINQFKHDPNLKHPEYLELFRQQITYLKNL